MDTDKIKQDLTRRFAAPLPEFYKRRIIFWYDEDREFQDQLEEISLDGVELLILTGSNTFVQGGRGNVAHLYVFQQESKGNRVFSKRGRKIY